MFALVDGNNFYASCEQVFQPELRGKPLVVLSNNDGCAIARSAEAKALGIKMGHPWHELSDFVRRHGLLARSANFTLYGDISARVVSILRETAPRVEVYSIDESFLDLSGIRDRVGLAKALRARVRRCTGIPNCIGIGPTKTLAKLANKVAKKGAGVVDLSDPRERAAALQVFPVGDVWGVGRRWEAKLASLGITTAAQLMDAPPDMILERFGVVLSRTQRELAGQPCHALEEVEPDRQQIMVSRSFGERVEEHAAVAQALATFATRACEKLRKRGLSTSAVTVFASTDVFRPELRQHHPSRSLTLPSATQDTRVVLAAVQSLLRGMLRKGCAYKRAGVVLMDLARPEELQADLFRPAMIGNAELMATIDRINRRFGSGKIAPAATAQPVRPQWAMRQLRLSPCFTTRLSDLPRARC
ncbi:MAG: Y-family DNA polymerase [Thermomonas sp.]